MSLFFERILGYSLLCVGLACIVFAFFSMHSVLTDQAKPPEIFQTQSLTLTTSPGTSQPTVVTIAIDPDIRKIVNIFLYNLLMFFLVMVGGKMGSLGIQLIKEIKIKMKS